MNTYLDRLSERIRKNIPPGAHVPEGSDELFLLYALLAAVKGVTVEAQDVHDAWVLWMRLKGESHAAMVPFGDLDDETQREDEPFLTAILTTAEDGRRNEI